MSLSDREESTRQLPRQLWWGCLFLSSLIAMGSTFEAVRIQHNYNPPTGLSESTQRWAVGSITITFLIASLSLATLTLPVTSHIIKGTKVEVTLILVVLAFTCAAVGSSTNPATGLAVNAFGGVSFGNLYYSTWVAFGCALALLMSFIRTERGIDVWSEMTSRGHRFRSWVILIVTTLIVMASSASTFDAQCDVPDSFKPIKYCHRAALGVSVGCIGCVASLTIVTMRLTCSSTDDHYDSPSDKYNKTIFALEGLFSVILFSMYGFAVAYLTSEKGPGAPLGNLYYSSWITFGIIFFISASCFEEYQAAKSMILTGRQKQREQQIELEPFTSKSNEKTTDSGRVGAGPTDWMAHERAVEEAWGENGYQQEQLSVSTFGKRSTSSVGEIQIS